MTTLTVTPAQAQALAQRIAAARAAEQAAHDALTLLTLGHVPADAVLADVNTDTGVLTFHVQQPPSPEGADDAG